MKALKDSNAICKKGKYYERDETGKGFFKAFQPFKILLSNVDALITQMELADEVMNTQLYDKVDEYKTL